MKKFLLFLGLGSLLVGSALAQHAGEKEHVLVRPDALKWGPAPPALPAGSQMALLAGEPGKPGVSYVLRAKLPDGYKIPPHWHPSDENVTVLQGAFLIGKGDRLDPAAMETLPAGSFTRLPKSMRHYAMARGETMIQVHGIGPFEINYVNPADDPRKKQDR